MRKAKVLVVEDEPDIAEVITYNLRREGHKVIVCKDGEKGLSRAKTERPALVLLDLMLPGIDGLEMCRRMKSDPITKSIPIIMVTAKSEEDDVILGLGIGADDYIAKPFKPKELLARVRVALRRAVEKEADNTAMRVVRGPLTIDLDFYEARVDDEPLDLTPTQMRLLHFLASHQGRVFPRAQLLNRAIAEDALVSDRNIDVHIRALRLKLGERSAMIETVRGVGYRFNDPDT